jgi:hypothetical protein
MWELILFIAAGVAAGWGVRGIIDRKQSSSHVGEPEMMWFNDEKARWERVTAMQLHVADRVVATVPIKLVKEREE